MRLICASQNFSWTSVRLSCGSEYKFVLFKPKHSILKPKYRIHSNVDDLIQGGVQAKGLLWLFYYS